LKEKLTPGYFASKKRIIVQEHHLSYDPPRVVYIRKGEHKILTLMQWYLKSSVSKGFLTALRRFIKENAGRAEDLRGAYKWMKSN